MTNGMTAEDVITLLELAPLPGEGGYFRQTWFSGEPDTPAATAIYYLVTPDAYSGLHRLDTAELFHFYAGDPCTMLQVWPDGAVSEITIGNDLAAGQRPQVLVPPRVWQGTRLAPGGSWALLGTTMTPGYRPDRFELATEEHLRSFDPPHLARIRPYLAAAGA